MNADRDSLSVGWITPHEDGVFLLISVVPERDDLKLAEASRKVGYRGNADADLVGPVAPALMIAPIAEQFGQGQLRQAHGRILAHRDIR